MQFDFKDKVVLITGGSRGIGRIVAQQFAEAGATIVVNYRSNDAAANETLASLPGERHMVAKADMGDASALAQMVSDVIARLGRLDILVNNAGIFEYHKVAESSFEAWQQSWHNILNVNLVGAANLIFLASQHMIEQGGGRIVNVSSRGAFRGEPDAPAYGASKAGMNAMGQSLAKALAPHNVFVHTVAPGFVETDMAASLLDGPMGDNLRNQSPLGRVAQPDEVARTVLFCAAPGTEFLTGCIIDVNGASYLRS